MTNTIPKSRMTVDGVPLNGAHIIVPLDQLATVTAALTAGGVTFWVAGRDIKVGHYPPVKWVSLSRSCDASHVQSLLDRL